MHRRVSNANRHFWRAGQGYAQRRVSNANSHFWRAARGMLSAQRLSDVPHAMFVHAARASLCARGRLLPLPDSGMLCTWLCYCCQGGFGAATPLARGWMLCLAATAHARTLHGSELFLGWAAGGSWGRGCSLFRHSLAPGAGMCAVFSLLTDPGLRHMHTCVHAALALPELQCHNPTRAQCLLALLLMTRCCGAGIQAECLWACTGVCNVCG